MKKHFDSIARLTLVLTYLVIIAGAVVRMTGSGMGCPDWPKCFGYYIPPTEITQLQFKPNHNYNKGVVIIKDESLLVVKNNFKSDALFNTNNWKTYTKHDYAIFNPLHTWVEYINRLFGALAGLATLVLAFVSFSFWKKKKSIPIVSVLIVFGMGFQAWLGKTVVDSNLSPFKITVHMVMALVIVAMILYVIHATKVKQFNYKHQSLFKTVLIIAIVLTLVQIVLGTQVRQFIDEQIKIYGDSNTSLWLQNATVQFYIHRSFSIVVLLTNGFLFYQNRKQNLGFSKINWVILLLLLEIGSGLLMAYMHFPFGTQTIHLVIATLLFGVQFYMILEALKTKNFAQTL